jgi:hypothetical protein
MNPATWMLAMCMLATGQAFAGGLHATLTVHTDRQADGTSLFEYTVTNLPSSELPVVSFGISIAEACRVGAITSPQGWRASYTPELPWIPWDAKRGIVPGQEARFMFKGNCNLTEQMFTLMAPDPAGLYMRDDTGYYTNQGVVDWRTGSPVVKTTADSQLP